MSKDSRLDPPSSRHAWWLLAGGCLLLVPAMFAVLLPALPNQFVWDDLPLLTENFNFRGLGTEQVRWAFSTAWYGPYQPIPWLTYGLDYLLWGLDPRGFHLTNIILHGLNLVLFVAVAWQLFNHFPRRAPALAAIFGSLFAAGLFAFHPMRAESVIWASSRRDILSGTFTLLTVLAYLRAFKRGRGDRLHPESYLASISLFLAALLSKATVVGLPIVLLLIDAYPLQRVRQAGWRRVLIEKAPMLTLALACSIVAMIGQKSAGTIATAGVMRPLDRLMMAAYGMMFYPRAMFAQWTWLPLYGRPIPFDPWQPRFIWSAVSLVMVTA